LLRAPSNLALNTSREGASTTSLGNLFQCFTTIFLAPLLVLHILHLILEKYSLLLQSSTRNFLYHSRKGETRGVHARRKSSVRRKEGLQSMEEEWYLGRRKTSGQQRR